MPADELFHVSVSRAGPAEQPVPPDGPARWAGSQEAGPEAA